MDLHHLDWLSNYIYPLIIGALKTSCRFGVYSNVICSSEIWHLFKNDKPHKFLSTPKSFCHLWKNLVFWPLGIISQRALGFSLRNAH